MASRPLEMVSVIGMPGVNCVDAVLPTATLMPAGLEVTLFPPRPVAETALAAPCATVTLGGHGSRHLAAG